MGTSATLKGLEYTKTAAILARTASAESFPNASKRKLHALYDEFVDADTAWDLASEIGFGILPKGARVLGFIVSNVAVGAAVTATIKVGDTTASDTWTSMNSANQQYLPVLAAVGGAELTADSVVTVVTGGATLASTKKISVATLYLIED